MINIHNRIFITGVTGFVGANILHRLISLGANDVHILIRSNSDSSRIQTILDKVSIHTFSLENREEVLKNIEGIQPQIIFHLAALGTSVGRIPSTLEELMKANMIGTANLIDAANHVHCECFIHTGSSSEYGQKDTMMSESDLLEPNNLYGISKAAATQYAVFVGKSTQFPIAIYRLFSVYGQLEEPKRLISTLVKHYREGIQPHLSSPHSVRDFIYIDDVVDCFLNADIACQLPGEIFNIGTGIQSSIADVVDLLQSITGSQIEPEYGSQKINQIEPKFWVANNEKMKDLLQVDPISLDEGLNIMYSLKI